jgi:hypothetical protein
MQAEGDVVSPPERDTEAVGHGNSIRAPTNALVTSRAMRSVPGRDPYERSTVTLACGRHTDEGSGLLAVGLTNNDEVLRERELSTVTVLIEALIR